MTANSVTNSIVRSLLAALRAEGWTITPPRPDKRQSSDGPLWAAENVEIVRVMWPDMTISTAEICGRVGRSLNAVKHKARSIGVQRRVGRPMTVAPVDLGACQDKKVTHRVELVFEGERIPLDSGIAQQTEIVSTAVAPKSPAPKMADRDPLPAPRKGKRGGIDLTGRMMGDPGCGNRREAESEYHRGGSELG